MINLMFLEVMSQCSLVEDEPDVIEEVDDLPGPTQGTEVIVYTRRRWTQTSPHGHN